MITRNESQLMRGDTPSTIIKFFLGAEKNEAESTAQNKAVHDEHEFIAITFSGNNTSEVIRRVTEADKSRFSEQYGIWKKDGINAMSGTPLKELPFLTTAAIADLSYHKVFTAEQLADLSDTAIQTVGMGARQWKDLAGKFLTDAAARNSGVRALAEENEGLKMDVARLTEQLAELASRLEESLKDSGQRAQKKV